MWKSVALPLFAATLSLAYPGTHQCRCRPHEPCWPSGHQWQALNNSIDGNLQAIRPVGSVCHDPTYDHEACQEAMAMTHDSEWRSSQPGAVQWINWESWSLANETCYIGTSRSEPCGQGKISEYSAVVESPDQIQQAVRFAKDHNLRLAIRNTGHDFLGRSTAPDSFQIFTHRMKNITQVEDFVPESSYESEGPAVTIEAGVQLSELYKALDAMNVVVVAGFANTVGAAGGYIQGGGHSPLGPWAGMSADNALEFKVVTADGDLVTANEYQNEDLFWALRGGGGGTFGVVTSVTLRAYPDVPSMSSQIGFYRPVADDAYWDAVRDFYAFLPTMVDAGVSGYVIVTPQQVSENGTTMALGGAQLFFVNQTDESEARKLFEPLLSDWEDTLGYRADLNFTQLPKITSYFAETLKGSDYTGAGTAMASRLISREFLKSPDGPAAVAQAIKDLDLPPNDQALGNIVGGGQVARNADLVDNAINPAWRKTICHEIITRGWSEKQSLAEQKAIQDDVLNVVVPTLKSLEPGEMGAYVNEANANEPDFQEAFWGENYERLYQIKQEWDPHGLFIARLGVGSEDWDDAGLCRIN
ncbi:hypothetical protein FQN54_001258 [Arachnomyces sp. PD_36]|nr:hypothetical protein FQN54_001258 [Arachnomyces sp. PD_36]